MMWQVNQYSQLHVCFVKSECWFLFSSEDLPPPKICWEKKSSVYVCVHTHMCVCVCVCVWERERGYIQSFQIVHLEREPQMVQLSASRCSCINILWVSLVTFAATGLCVASQWVFIVVSIHFIINSVQKLLDTPWCIYTGGYKISHYDKIYLWLVSSVSAVLFTVWGLW
jgi:hypothetical protein